MKAQWLIALSSLASLFSIGVAGCAKEDTPAGDVTANVDEAVTTGAALAAGEFFDWDQFRTGASSIRSGVDPRFAAVKLKNVDSVQLATANGLQEITLKASAGASVQGNGNGDFEKQPFRSQVQMGFVDANGHELALCYCNICPVADGDPVSCKTDQWVLRTDVSDDGACKAPDKTAKVVVTVEAVAKQGGDFGTAVVKRFRVGRCAGDGTCNDVEPTWY